MSSKHIIDIKTLLDHPEIKKATHNVSPEAAARQKFNPPVCEVFSQPYTTLKDDDQYRFFIDKEAKLKLPDIVDNKVQSIVGGDDPDGLNKKEFTRSRNIGIVFSGGPAPGGHNVIAGVYDAAKKANRESKIFGFLEGPDGILENECIEITRGIVDAYRNVGGFTMIKTGRTKIESKANMALSRETCQKLGLDVLVVVGGDDSNTNAAFLAQELINDGVQVIGVPKTIDGDIQVRDEEDRVLCAISFGFHTAARAFANEISNLCSDSSSDVKYWHICKVMGRVASHLALEVALQTHANITLIGEDLADYVDEERIQKAKTVDHNAYGVTLRHLSRVLCDCIVRRAAVGKNYGVVVIPEGVLEFINEIQVFIIKLNTIIADYNKIHDNHFHSDFQFLDDKLDYLRRLARQSREGKNFQTWNTRDDDLFDQIPEFFQKGLLIERDIHGNFQFSQVETEKVILGLVKEYLNVLKEKGIYKIGIEKRYFNKIAKKGNLDPDVYGPILFDNYSSENYLLMRRSIISKKTLKEVLKKARVISEEESIPGAVETIFNRSVPHFKTQAHFFGYDGRGNDPTWFDCTYTYNLGLTVFSLIANGATGQMAAIKNLEKNFSDWEPIGIPIAALMHLEERKGKLSLVIEKSLVDINSTSFKVVKELRDKWLAATPGPDCYRRPGPIRFAGDLEEDRPMTLLLNAIGEA